MRRRERELWCAGFPDDTCGGGLPIEVPIAFFILAILGGIFQYKCWRKISMHYRIAYQAPLHKINEYPLPDPVWPAEVTDSMVAAPPASWYERGNGAPAPLGPPNVPPYSSYAHPPRPDPPGPPDAPPGYVHILS